MSPADAARRLPDIHRRALVRLATASVDWCDTHPNIRDVFRRAGLVAADGEVTELGYRTADLLAEEGA